MIQYPVSRLSSSASPIHPVILATLVLALSLSVQAPASAQAPTTDIGLFRITDPGKLELSSFLRVTDRPLYDNQPSFLTPDILLYTAMKEAPEGSASTTEIVRYELGSGERRVLVTTAESEYSATKIPGREAISVVRDYGDLKQQLWSYSLATSGPSKAERHLLPGINPVGYHAWVDDQRLILFVLGEPATLQLATVGPEAGHVLAENPGRALARIPQTDRMSFVHKVSAEEWWLCAVDVDSSTPASPGGGKPHGSPAIERLIQMPRGNEDYAWAPGGWVWTGQGSKLLRAWPGKTNPPNKGLPIEGNPAEDAEWQEVADLTALGIQGISRMAFDPTGQRLALVFDR